MDELKKGLDTIVAAATPLGVRSGVAIIRISGESSLILIQKLSGRFEFVDRTATFCRIDTGKVRDEALILYFKGPHSYTGEDMAEIQCHGNPLITGEIIRYICQNGARLADSGEFTKRAFLNGKVDLTAAEAVMDIIDANTFLQLDSAMGVREGQLFTEIGEIQSQIYDLIAELNAAIDYPEEDIEEPAAAAVASRAEGILSRLKLLAATYSGGRLIRDGVNVAICGAPNVGKSSLLNRLLGKDRAIVTDMPGTTRDTVEDSYQYNGIIFNIADTAGIRSTENFIEKMGIERAVNAINQCDIVLAVAGEDGVFEGVPKNKRVVYLLNKIDLLPKSDTLSSFPSALAGDNISCEDKLPAKKIKSPIRSDESKKPQVLSGSCNKAHAAAGDSVINSGLAAGDEPLGIMIGVSALTGENIEKIKSTLYELSCKDLSRDGVMLTSLRHYEAVRGSIEYLNNAIEAASRDTLEIITLELTDAAHALGQITGLIGSEEVVGRIFARFCVGK